MHLWAGLLASMMAATGCGSNAGRPPGLGPTIFTGNARFLHDLGHYLDFIKPTVTHIKPFTSNPVLPNNQGTANVADNASLQFQDANLTRYMPGFSGEVQGGCFEDQLQPVFRTSHLRLPLKSVRGRIIC